LEKQKSFMGTALCGLLSILKTLDAKPEVTLKLDLLQDRLIGRLQPQDDDQNNYLQVGIVFLYLLGVFSQFAEDHQGMETLCAGQPTSGLAQAMKSAIRNAFEGIGSEVLDTVCFVLIDQLMGRYEFGDEYGAIAETVEGILQEDLGVDPVEPVQVILTGLVLAGFSGVLCTFLLVFVEIGIFVATLILCTRVCPTLKLAVVELPNGYLSIFFFNKI
jgi:hypothetical protein